jgi:hypothetical protein
MERAEIMLGPFRPFRKSTVANVELPPAMPAVVEPHGHLTARRRRVAEGHDDPA